MQDIIRCVTRGEMEPKTPGKRGSSDSPEAASKKPRPAVSNEAATGTWTEHVDKASGRTYYHNSATKQSVWTKPPELLSEDYLKQDEEDTDPVLADENGEDEDSEGDSDDGVEEADAVGFHYPDGICIDPNGMIFVSDSLNHRIVQLDGHNPDVFQRHAGGTGEGLLNDVGMEALFCCPKGLAISPSGDLIIADQENHMIRKMSSLDGEVTTVAGCRDEGFQDGPTAEAMFSVPMGVACAEDGTFFVVDNGNHCIRKVDTDGIVSTFAGCGKKGFRNGAGSKAMFNHPVGIALDKDGNVLVGDNGNDRVRIISPAGVVKTFAGSGVQGYSDGKAMSAKFFQPQGLVVTPAGDVVVADYGNECVRKISTRGFVSTIAGTRKAGFDDGQNGSFNQPVAVACDRENNFYVVDQGNHAVRVISPDAAGRTTVSTLCGFGMPVITVRSAGDEGDSDEDRPLTCSLEPNTRDYMVFGRGM